MKNNILVGDGAKMHDFIKFTLFNLIRSGDTLEAWWTIQLNLVKDKRRVVVQDENNSDYVIVENDEWWDVQNCSAKMTTKAYMQSIRPTLLVMQSKSYFY